MSQLMVFGAVSNLEAACEIADVLGWEEDRAERLLAVYVDRDDIVREIANRIARNEAGT